MEINHEPKIHPNKMSEVAESVWNEFMVSEDIDEFQVYDYGNIITVHFNGQFDLPARTDDVEINSVSSIESDDSSFGARVVYDIE